MINAGDFNQRITIVRDTPSDDGEGFNSKTRTTVVSAWAKVNTTKGFTLISQGSNFENATTRLLIRKPNASISRKDLVLFKGREWKIRYLNDIDEAGVFVELQVEEVRQNG
jgi:SPP1 family predicted phage head-tail adaptor